MENNEILKNLTPEGIKQQQEKIEQNQENNSFKEKDDSLRISEINTEISKKEKDIETTNNSINNIRDSFGLPPNDEIPPSIQSQKDSLEKLNQERLDIETKIQEKEKHQTPEENETKELNSQENIEMTQEEYDAIKDDLKMLNKKIQETRGIINLSEDSFKSEYGRKRYKELNFIGEGKPVRFNQTELQTIGDEMEGVLGKATVKKEQTELEKAREEEQAIFAEFKKFTEENPEEKIPEEMEERYRQAEERLRLAQEKAEI